MGIPLGLGILANLGTLGIPLGLEILGKTTENLENFGTLGIPLGWGILGKNKENLENLGTVGMPPGLDILGKIWPPGLGPPFSCILASGLGFSPRLALQSLCFLCPRPQTCVKRAPGYQ